jgi:hypothetical protein
MKRNFDNFLIKNITDEIFNAVESKYYIVFFKDEKNKFFYDLVSSFLFIFFSILLSFSSSDERVSFYFPVFFGVFFYVLFLFINCPSSDYEVKFNSGKFTKIRFNLLIFINCICILNKKKRAGHIRSILIRKQVVEERSRLMTNRQMVNNFNNIMGNTTRVVLSIKKNRDISDTKINDFFIQDIDYFMKLLNRTEMSFKRFLKEIIHDTQNKSSIYLWLHCIPRNLSLDGTKDLIKANRLNEVFNSGIIIDYIEKIGEKRFMEGWDNIFCNYSEKQFKRLFNVDYSGRMYIKCLIGLKEYKKGIKVFTNLELLECYINKNQYALVNNLYDLNQKEKFPEFKKIESINFNKYSFVVIEDLDDLDFWGNKMKNCIRNYFEPCHKGEICLIGVLKNDKPYGNISITKSSGDIQIKGYANAQIEDHSLIHNQIKSIID